jgi:hypothetical protein
MSQLYARVFTQILDSSIAEDFEVRHVFEDFLKVCTTGEHGGIVDVTRHALARKFNIPLDKLNRAIELLEAPDESSRNQDHEGRRLARLDGHRDWGWQILNWKEYDQVRSRAEATARVAKHRASKKVQDPAPPPKDPKSEIPAMVSKLREQAEAIYEAYPKKVGKPKAINSILSALGQFDFDLILSRTALYAKSRAGEDPQYTAHPTTWFNQHRFNDDPSTWKSSKQDVHDRNANNMNGRSEKGLAGKLQKELQDADIAEIQRQERLSAERKAAQLGINV